MSPALPKFTRRRRVALICVIAAVALTGLAILIFEFECDSPTEDAHRVLVPVVDMIRRQQLERTGKIGDIDAELRLRYPGVLGLNRYRVIVQQTPHGEDVIVRPSTWCFCRATFVLHEGGKRLEILMPRLSLSTNRK